MSNIHAESYCYKSIVFLVQVVYWILSGTGMTPSCVPLLTLRQLLIQWRVNVATWRCGLLNCLLILANKIFHLQCRRLQIHLYETVKVFSCGEWYSPWVGGAASKLSFGSVFRFCALLSDGPCVFCINEKVIFSIKNIRTWECFE